MGSSKAFATTVRMYKKIHRRHREYVMSTVKPGDPERARTSGLQFRKLPLYPLSYGIIFQFSVQYIVAQLPLPVNTHYRDVFFKIYTFISTSNALLPVVKGSLSILLPYLLALRATPFSSASKPLYGTYKHDTIVPDQVKMLEGVQYVHC